MNTIKSIGEPVKCRLQACDTIGRTSWMMMNLQTRFHILKNIPALCKTSALGGHRERCDQCAYTRFHYNSCGNRSCPTCQGVNKENGYLLDSRTCSPSNISIVYLPFRVSGTSIFGTIKKYCMTCIISLKVYH